MPRSSSWTRILRRLSASEHPATASSRRRSPRASRPRYELLEERAVPAVLSTFLTTEHVDLNIGSPGGPANGWSLQPRDDDHGGLNYDPEEALLYVGDNAQSLAARPGDAAFNFVGVAAGEPFYRLPQSQDPELLYLGVAGYGVASGDMDRYNPSAESKGRVSGTGRWVKMSLVGVEHVTPAGVPGDGVFSVWQSGDSGPSVFMSSYNDGVSNPNPNGLDATDGVGADDALWVVAGGHIHYNFGFTEKGRYEVKLKLSGYVGDDGQSTPNAAGYVESTPITLYFSVGSVGELEFDAASYTVDEGAGTATIGVRRVGGSDGRISADYATSNGTAGAGSDYTSSAGTLVFNDGETFKTITVPILDDTQVEPDETLNLLLSGPGPASINNYYIDYEGDANGLLGSQATASLTIHDNDAPPPNTPPTISDVANLATNEDTATGAIPFTVGDIETAAGALVVTASSSNTALVPNANIALGGSGANRTVTLSPAANQFGTTTITLTVTDAGGLTATDTFVLTVNPINDAPLAVNDVYATDEDTALNVSAPGVLGNDSDVEGSSLTAVLVSGPSSGSLTLNANGSFSYTPAADFAGVVTFTYSANDGTLNSAVATVTINVGSVNDPPTIGDVADLATNEDTPTGAIPFTVGDSETAAGDLVVTAMSSNPTLVPNSNIVLGGNGANRTVTITPAPNQFGNTTITLTVTDEGGLRATDTFVLNVASVNDLPTISDIGNQTTRAGVSVGPISFTIGDVETALASLAVTAGSSNTTLLPLSGIVIAGSGANRSVTLTPAAGQTGSTTVTLTVTDADGGSRLDTFLLTVTFNGLVPFAMPTYYGSTLSASRTVTGDFNGDGFIDKVTSDTTINSLAYFQGTGAGGFQTERRLNAAQNLYALGIDSVDYDSDGDLDLVAVEATDNPFDTFEKGIITLYRNDGTGQFSRVVLASGLKAGTNVAAGDFNGDGRPDLAWSSSSIDRTTFAVTATYDYALQDAGGGLGPVTTLANNDIFVTLKAQDINGDGKTDLIGVERPGTAYAMRVRLGNGDGTFRTPLVVVSDTNAKRLRQIVDLNGDGRLDLLVTDTTGDSKLGYYPQQADGSFGARVGLLQGIGRSLSATQAADVNKDGVLDIVTQYLGGAFGSGLVPSIYWAPGLGGGAYGTPILVAPQNVSVSHVEVCSAPRKLDRCIMEG